MLEFTLGLRPAAVELVANRQIFLSISATKRANRAPKMAPETERAEHASAIIE
jgi:hypothetical protein